MPSKLAREYIEAKIVIDCELLEDERDIFLLSGD